MQEDDSGDANDLVVDVHLGDGVTDRPNFLGNPSMQEDRGGDAVTVCAGCGDGSGWTEKEVESYANGRYVTKMHFLCSVCNADGKKPFPHSIDDNGFISPS
jgi:hypothetical protein